jgi:hypothetical protein
MRFPAATRALVGAFWLGATTCAAQAAAPPAVATAGDCVAALRNVHAGSGAKSFASAYVFTHDYAYGEWAAGVARGQSLWHRRGTVWCKVPTGTSALDERAIVGYGVPAADARELVTQMASTAQIAPPQPPKDVRHH